MKTPRIPGKKMPFGYYVHKDYVQVIENLYEIDVSRYAKSLPKDFQYTIVKFNPATCDVSFIFSPDWDTSAHESIVGDGYLVREDGTTRLNRQHKDPWIYHHKWMFVADDYAGFDVKRSKQRSKHWTSLPNINKSKIGKLSYWKAKILPLLKEEYPSNQ